MPRSATCIAYDHPESSKFGRVELVRIDAELLNDLRKASSQWETEILGLTEKRAEHAKKQIGLPFWHEGTEERLTERFDELGLVQGQKMMLIDLYRCTRCDKCVDACVKTHKDKRSRLFLDGPRYQRQEDSGLRTYLVPATCRQCKDPVCLIGCPVGSIHKGDNGQIVIENWCIGCQRCAQQCPYGAIQMHAVGIIPRRARGWCYRFRSDDSWHEGQTPFTYNRKLREQSSGKSEVHFRYAFRLAQDVAQKTKSFQLRILSLAPVLTVTTNGKQVLQTSPGQSPPKPKKDKSEEYNHEVMLFLESGPAEGQQDKSVGLPVMRLEENVIEICLGLPVNEDAVLLDLGLYAFSKPSVPTELAEELNQEVVMNTAVVCDMCSSQFGKQPACVNACPHDAAIRVDAQVFLGPELRG